MSKLRILASVSLACLAVATPFLAKAATPVTVTGSTGNQATVSGGALYISCVSGCGPGGTTGVDITQVGGNAVTTTIPVSGTVTVTDGAGALNVIVDSSALPSGASTAAKQPALGTAGTASADVITIQGIASMTAVKVDGSAVTQPVSGTVTTNPTPITTGGCTPYGYQSAASTNSTSVKGSAGNVCGGVVINTTATLYYLRFYDSSSAPTCSSATNFIATVPVPASTTGAGTLINFGSYGANFSNGIGFCLTGGGTSTDNTNAAVGVFLTLSYK